MTTVDRGNYVTHNPYMDAPQGIGYGVTISAPHMVCTLVLMCSKFEIALGYCSLIMFESLHTVIYSCCCFPD